MAIRTNTARDLLPLAVLALLSEQPRHPYELLRVMRERHIEFAVGRTRALYATVDALARGGLIEAVETSREGRRPERTIYRITDEGRDEFVDWLESLLQAPSSEPPVFLGAVGLLYYVPTEGVLEALQSRVVALEGLIAQFDATIATLRDRFGLPRFLLLDHEYRLVLLRAESAWLATLIEDISQKGLPTLDDLRAYFDAERFSAASRAGSRSATDWSDQKG
jgi:DNA-binding PadR family transcriptional regulator